jgi:hypothetical protein
MLRKLFRLIVLIGIVLSLCVIAPFQTAHALIIWTVDSTADAAADGVCNTSAGDCTLRDAIGVAVDGDIINITAGPLIIVNSGLGPYYLNKNLTITGPGRKALSISGNNLTRVFYIYTGSSVSISDLTITKGYTGTPGYGGAILNYGVLTLHDIIVSDSYAQYSGGGIYNQPGTSSSLTITDSSIIGNNASNGGGIYSPADTPLSLTNVEISSNTAHQWGGGVYIDSAATLYANTFNKVYVYSNTAGIGGGGIYLANGTYLTITNSALQYNQAVEYGGAISTYANNLADASTISLKNVTISENSLIHEPGSRQGAGMYIQGHAILNNVTMVENNAGYGASFTNQSYGGAFYSFSPAGSTMSIKNSIIANNYADNGPICAGTSFAAGAIQYTLLKEQTCYATNGVNGVIVGLDPLVDALTTTGYKSVHPLTAASPARNVGQDATCEARDQRGVSRPQGSHCDMGSSEYLQTFNDVTQTHQYWEDIEILYANGLTAGCSASPLNFCPDQIMDRAQSAVFNLRGNYGNSYTPPAAPWNTFADDWSAGTWAEKWAEGMYNAGLTAGCATSPLRYCPWDQTPKVQAAVFGLRLKYGNSYAPPAATGTVFFDMTNPAYFGTKWSEQAYADGLLPDCGTDIGSGKPLFCPNDLVSRGLGAYMIVRAKSLSMP